jgi:uncharacterized repeat protein (TIGR01451 family)
MHGRYAGVIAAVLLAGGIACPGGRCAAGELPPDALPRIDVQQAMPLWVTPGEAVAVDVVIRNTGTASAENVTASSNLPASLELTEADPPPGRVRESLLWTLGTLPPGGRQVLRLRLTPRAGASLAEVRSSIRVTYQCGVSSSAVAALRRPALALNVTGPGTAVVGEPVTLQITVSNNGTLPAQGVSLQTLLPEGLTHPGGRDLENDLGTLAVGESRQATLAVMPTQAGELRARVRACAGGAEPAEREARLRVREIKLTLAANGPRLLYENWPGTFEVAVQNEGAEPVAQVCLAITLPDGLAFVRASDGGVYAAATHSLYWDLGTLRPGDKRTLAWNGVARTAGEQPCRIKLVAGLKATRQMTWQTTVARAGLQQAAAAVTAPAGSAPAPPPAPAAPLLAAPPGVPGPPPQLPPGGGEGSPPGALSQVGGAPDPSPWRPNTGSSPRPPAPGGSPATSP